MKWPHKNTKSLGPVLSSFLSFFLFKHAVKHLNISKFMDQLQDQDIQLASKSLKKPVKDP